MPENPISRMALWAAYFRGFHSQHASQKVFDDFLAAPIVHGLLAENFAVASRSSGGRNPRAFTSSTWT
jgi:hypothetical protein